MVNLNRITEMWLSENHKLSHMLPELRIEIMIMWHENLIETMIPSGENYAPLMDQEAYTNVKMSLFKLDPDNKILKRV